MDVKMLVEMIEEIMEEEATLTNEAFYISAPAQGGRELYPLQTFMDDVVPIVKKHGGTYQGSKGKNPITDSSGHSVVHFTGLGSLINRDKIITDLIATHPEYFSGKGAKERRNGLFHRIQTVFTTKRGKPIYLQFNAGGSNKGFRLERELQDLFKKAKIAVRVAERNQEGADLETEVDFGDGHVVPIKVEVKAALGHNAEMYQAPLVRQGETDIYTYKHPDRRVERAMRQFSGNVNPKDLKETPVPEEVIRLIFQEKFHHHDMFYIKNGFYSPGHVKNNGEYFYRFREASPGKGPRLNVYLQGGLEDAHKLEYLEMETILADWATEGATYKQ